jgi:hypothetical protein
MEWIQQAQQSRVKNAAAQGVTSHALVEKLGRALIVLTNLIENGPEKIEKTIQKYINKDLKNIKIIIQKEVLLTGK